MSTILSVDEIFGKAYPKLCSYAEAKKKSKYASQVKWAERTYVEQFDGEEDEGGDPDPSEDRGMVFEHLRSVEAIMKNMTEKTVSLEAALHEHKREVEAVHALFAELQRTVAGVLRRLDEKRDYRQGSVSFACHKE